jgi:hypothetical protein
MIPDRTPQHQPKFAREVENGVIDLESKMAEDNSRKENARDADSKASNP